MGSSCVDSLLLPSGPIGMTCVEWELGDVLRDVKLARVRSLSSLVWAPCTKKSRYFFSKLQVTQQQHNGEKIGDCSMIGNCKAYICIQKSSQMDQF